MFASFNPFNKAVILRINETRDLGEATQFAFYDRMKTYLASPPEGLSTNEKHIKRYTVANACGVIFTTNYKENGLYLPANDRRHFVAWSERKPADFAPGYWAGIWDWSADGGFGHVGAFLRGLDLSGFEAKAPPQKTAAFWAIANANRATEETELGDVLDQMGRPAAVTLEQIMAQELPFELGNWLRDRKNRRIIAKHLRESGYDYVANPDAESGLWIIKRKRQTVYARDDLSLGERQDAARRLTEGNTRKGA
jgi:hypothetical protein